MPSIKPLRSNRSGRPDPPPPGVRAEPYGFESVRFVEDGGERILGGYLRNGSGSQGIKVLALSGGGAGGAFGAGALVGLSQAGQRPVFNLVTGVSTGALIAPFAFLGEAWDSRLTDAFTDGFASEALSLRAVRPGIGLYRGEQLSRLVGRYVDRELLDAVAAGHRSGRRLLVATANLDAQTTSIWDMGAVASSGQPGALELFATVLVASASLPGIFPPVIIDVECEGQRYSEMHVDGGAITPLFVLPDGLRLHGDDAEQAVDVYALFNTSLNPDARTTRLSPVPILVRSFELMLRSSYRNALRAVAATCELNGFNLHMASVPPAIGGASMLRFDRTTMSTLFAQARQLALDGGLWSSPLPRASRL